ncbi:extracellular solute-binding protein [Devosia sp. A8/3-2]|nr:extracellular solute-binding protein [Devosia sp. A8/3-2]
MSLLNRRKFLGTAAAAAGSAAILSATGNAAFARDRRIRHFWWGNPERDKRTFEVIRLFNENNPGIVVAGETLGSADYFTRLTTQIAGRNMADAIQMGYGVMFEYINRGAILPLDDYLGKSLDVSQIDESAFGRPRRWQALRPLNRRQFARLALQYPPVRRRRHHLRSLRLDL